MKKNKKILISLAIALFSISQLSTAANLNSSMEVSTNLTGACSITFADITFSSISYKSDAFQLGGLTSVCSKDTTTTLSASTLHQDQDVYTYLVHETDPTQKVRYSLNPPGKNPLVQTPITILGTGESVFQWLSLVIYRNQYVKPGNYRDTVTLTLSY